MSTLTTTWSPSSYQLRLAAFNCRKPPSVLMRVHVHRLRCHSRCRSSSRDNGNVNVTEQPTNSKLSSDAFSGWFGDNNGSDESKESQPKKGWSGGMVGAGVAGAILVAGLAFATLSMNKKASGPRQNIDSPPTHQEESLASADQKDNGEEGIGGENAMEDTSLLEGKAGIEKDSSLLAKETENTTENKLGGDPNLEYTSNGGVVTDNVSSQQDFQEELPVDEVQSDPVETPKLQKSDVQDDLIDASSIENPDENIVPEKLEVNDELREDETYAEVIVLDVNPTNPNTDYEGVDTAINRSDKSSLPLDSSSSSIPNTASEQGALKVSVSSQLDSTLEPQLAHQEDIENISSNNEDFDLSKMQELSGEENNSFPERQILDGGLFIPNPDSDLPNTFANEQNDNEYNDNITSTSNFDSVDLGKFSSSASIPAPSVVSPALQALPGKVLIPAVVDQVQGQALAALQVLKVIEGDVQPGDLCTRREYARWLVSASSALSRNTISKVYPAMYIENVTELAFDDITPEDPDFSSIQGLAEAGLIASKFSRRDMNSSDQDESSLCFCPESPLSRQDLVSWKMSLEKRLLPVSDRRILQQLSGFVDIDKINPDAFPALIADLSAGDQGIVGLAFGYTRLFQPDKPVTKAQAAIALATGEASDIVGEELARIEAESIAEKAVAAHSALVDQVEKDVNESFEKDILLEREKIIAVEKMAEGAKRELEQLRAEREEESIKLMKQRAAVESEMEVFSKLRREMEEQLQSIMSNKVEISYEKERLNKLRTDAETENQEIARLQYELEVERKALAMARSWAEDEAKRAREQAKVLEEARERWESRGLKVVVENDLREDATSGVSWLTAGDQFSVEGTKNRAQNLVEKLKSMAGNVREKSRTTIEKVIQKILLVISQLKEWGSKAGSQLGGVKDDALTKVNGSIQDLQKRSTGLGLSVKEGAKRVAGDCREGVEKLTQKFVKT